MKSKTGLGSTAKFCLSARKEIERSWVKRKPESLLKRRPAYPRWIKYTLACTIAGRNKLFCIEIKPHDQSPAKD